MYCSSCGAIIAEGRTSCAACGAPAALPSAGGAGVPRVAGSRGVPRERTVGQCPRCGYRGEGVGYFSRGLHVAALVGLTVMTAGAMAAGGIIYYLLRREHQVCPRCGLSWGRFGTLSLSPVPGSSSPRPAVVAVKSASGESTKRFLAVALWVLATILIAVGIAETELLLLLLGGSAAGGGWLLHHGAGRERAARRAALLAELQRPVLRLAGEHGGRLTVTEVAAELGWTLPRAEKVLNSLDDGLRVNSEVTDEGVIVYEFLELLRTPPRLARGNRRGELGESV